MVNRVFMLAPVVLFAMLAAALGLGLGHNPHELPSMLADRPVPAFDLPPLVAGVEGLKNTDLEGGKIVLLNVFASWCAGCRYEHPLLMTAAADPRINLVGINWKDDPVRGAQWIAQFGNPYRQIGDDHSGRAGVDLGVTGVPETFFIDNRGRVRYRHAGPLTLEAWKAAIEPVIAEIEDRSS